MKDKILALIILVTVIAFVCINTVILDKQIECVIEKVDALNFKDKATMSDASELYVDFMKKQKYLSLTVNHDDMTCIEDCLIEMIGYVSVDDLQNAEVTKYRLKNSLEHLRRLSGFNIDAII